MKNLLPVALTLLLCLGLVLCLPPLTAQEQGAAAADVNSLTAPERAVLEYLHQDWGKQFRSTSIGLAAQATGKRLGDTSRLRLARHLEANRASHPVPARHGVTTVALTPEEKLVARALLLFEARDAKGATVDQVAGGMRLSHADVRRSLAFLEELDIVSATGEGSGRRFKVAARFSRRPTWRIDFYSHKVQVNRGAPFEVA